MIYIREIFRQDLRDGKQIAFPKEPSIKFFEFNYQDNPGDRNISFTFVPRNGVNDNWRDHRIDTRLYAAGSESRIDGQLKAFLRDNLNAQIGDLLIVYRKDRDNTNFTFSHISIDSQYYNQIHELLDGKNHTIAEVSSPAPIPSLKFEDASDNLKSLVRAIRTKPFVLLAGISGTGKSRIVRKLAQACWEPGSEEAKAHKPSNFEMIQVKPNWHDSSELLGYVSRIGKTPQFIVGDFLKFIAKAWENPSIPHFLCLDEMNLAPVEQYFAEYLSVVESRKLLEDGKTIVSDPLLKMEDEEWYHTLTASIATSEEIRLQFNKDGIAIPQNLIVIGTVNMDETTYSFSRKVLDRAMTIEMNEVDLRGGLHKTDDSIPHIEPSQLLADAVEGFDVYERNAESCDKAIKYLEAVNKVLDKTPFKVAYRTRNELLIYTVNALKLADKEANINSVIARALDEVTSMKILSRIEGDKRKVGFLHELTNTIKNGLAEIDGSDHTEDTSVSLSKLAAMEERLKSGYTSFWD